MTFERDVTQGSVVGAEMESSKNLDTIRLVAVAVGVLYAFVRAVFRHRERMAMIQHGMMPYEAED